jgi:hypothetical protein
MQAPLELANKLLSILEHENTRDAIDALKIAMILLPIKLSASSTIRDETAQASEECLLEDR